MVSVAVVPRTAFPLMAGSDRSKVCARWAQAAQPRCAPAALRDQTNSSRGPAFSSPVDKDPSAVVRPVLGKVRRSERPGRLHGPPGANGKNKCSHVRKRRVEHQPVLQGVIRSGSPKTKLPSPKPCADPFLNQQRLQYFFPLRQLCR